MLPTMRGLEGVVLGALQRPVGGSRMLWVSSLNFPLRNATASNRPIYRRISFLGSHFVGLPLTEQPRSNRYHTFRAAAAASAALGSSRQSKANVDEEVKEYWKLILQSVEKPTAKRLLRHIDPSVHLGLPDIAAGGITEQGAKSSGRGGRPPIYSYFLQTKMQHPTKVVLVRVGEFYETVGIDAVLLVQHAGLNPMGKDGNPPRAGCPRGNLRRTVSDLVEGAGLSVVVCEEAPEPYSYGSMRKAPKQRYVAAVITPAAPHFLHGLVDEETDLAVESAPPLLGIAPQVGGYSVIEVDAELQTVRVSEGLTEDAVYARLYEGGLAPPLFIHVPAPGAAGDKRITEATPEGEWERRVGAVFRTQIGAVQKYEDPDPVYGMLERVKRQLSLPPDTHFTQLPSSSPRNRPRPLYYSTAANLGLHKTRGIPSLLDYALPPGAPLTARRWLRKLLLLPPPAAVGLAVHTATRELANASVPIPSFPVMAPANVVIKLRTQEANDTFFRELAELCRAVAAACKDPALTDFADSVLVPAGAETGVLEDRNSLAAACISVVSLIHDIVDHDTEVGTGFVRRGGTDGGADWGEASSSEGTSDGDDNGDGGGIGTGAENIAAENIKSGIVAPNSGGLAALSRLYASNEDFQGKIRPARLVDVYTAVSTAREQVRTEASRALQLALDDLPNAANSSTGSSTSTATTPTKSRAARPAARPALVYDVNNNAAWVRIPKSSPAVSRASSLGLQHPRDRNGKVEPGAFSTPGLESAQDDYRRACADARDAVRAQLRALALTLQSQLTQLVCAATFAVVASALDAHVREAARRGWSLPRLSYDTQGNSPESFINVSTPTISPSLVSLDPSFSSSKSSSGPQQASGQQQLVVEGMWPYWLGGTGGIDLDTVKNSFSMDGMFLLTGPNMAGKSTLLRSTCAVALLGACGLAVPANRGTTIPYIDAFMLRNFAADSPIEGRSSFAVEMTEMRYVLQDATSSSLVLVDELGKGTEATAGSALAGAMLEALDKIGCRGAFATHLHMILDMRLDLPRTKRMMMEVEDVEESKNNSGEVNGSNGANNSGQIISGASSGRRRFKRRATWRVVPGESTESLAIDVAAKCRLPEELLTRAQGLYSELIDDSKGGEIVGSGVEGLKGTSRQQTQNGSRSSSSSGDQDIDAGEAGLEREEKSSAAVDDADVSEGAWVLEASAASKELRQAAVVLENTCRLVLAGLSGEAEGEREVGVPSLDSQTEAEEGAQFVPSGLLPPARTVGMSCVYIARRPCDGRFYVGSSDGLRERILTHRRRSGSQVADPLAEFTYISVPQGGAGGSAARVIEAAVIKAMQAEGYSLLSVVDARRRHAPNNRYGGLGGSSPDRYSGA